MDFPKLIKECRQSLGETQAEFALRFDTHANTVSRWESGDYQASYDVIAFVLSRPTYIDLDKIWGNEPNRSIEVRRGGNERIYLTVCDDDLHTRSEISLESHNARRLSTHLVEATRVAKLERSATEADVSDAPKFPQTEVKSDD